MEILSNFSSAYCFISFILGALFMLTMLCIAAMGKVQEPMNNVHFYVARNKSGMLWIYLNKPIRTGYEFTGDVRNGVFMLTSHLEYFGLNDEDYKDIKWEDEPLEVFITLKD